MNVFKDIKATQDYSKRLPKSNSVEMNQLSDEINGLLTHIEDENIQEKERQRHLRELAECDPLTGINNKKAIEQKMLAMVQSATDKKVRISVGFLDIDDFKDYNTNYGHQEGDNVIKFVANTLKENFKGEVGRNGGDEFVFGYEGREAVANSSISVLAASCQKQKKRSEAYGRKGHYRKNSGRS